MDCVVVSLCGSVLSVFLYKFDEQVLNDFNYILFFLAT
jgi:hypothetical protein